MECRFRVLLRCPKCDRVFCVPELAGSSEVYHRECGRKMYRMAGGHLLSVAEHADRANVFYFKERDQLEVTNRAEGQ